MNEEVTAHPAGGSWVAELEGAKVELSKFAADADSGGVSAVPELEAHLRVCRAYCTLRQWERLKGAAKRGLIKCSSFIDSPSSDPVPSRFESSFRWYRKLARAELAVDSMLTIKGAAQAIQSNQGSPMDDTVEGRPLPANSPLNEFAFRDFGAMFRHNSIILGQPPESIYCHCESSCFAANANIFQNSVLLGDVRCMEEAVALGAALDQPFDDKKPEFSELSNSVVLPPGASALTMACVALVVADSADTGMVDARRLFTPRPPEQLDRVAECAMQLVRLGADPKLTLRLGRGPMSRALRAMDGKSAFQIAAMSKRRALVTLMLEHMQLGPQERAAVVHCRCGSRLPWKMCHSTGPGQPSHYMLTDTSAAEPQTHYRVSPMARCPCRNAAATYYKCCWNDNRAPVYQNDRGGNRIHAAINTQSTYQFDRLLQNLARDDPRNSIALFRESPEYFQALCADAGPKSNMPSWDPIVYAGCLERLEAPFLWKDVHWDLDRTVLIGRAAMWNAALSKYCDDTGLYGDERDRVVETHRANPCGPCAFVGCDAFEEEIREFQRCARCKLVAYCGRKCQRRDWADHRKVCRDCSKVVLLRY